MNMNSELLPHELKILYLYKGCEYWGFLEGLPRSA